MPLIHSCESAMTSRPSFGLWGLTEKGVDLAVRHLCGAPTVHDALTLEPWCYLQDSDIQTLKDTLFFYFQWRDAPHPKDEHSVEGARLLVQERALMLLQRMFTDHHADMGRRTTEIFNGLLSETAEANLSNEWARKQAVWPSPWISGTQYASTTVSGLSTCQDERHKAGKHADATLDYSSVPVVYDGLVA